MRPLIILAGKQNPWLSSGNIIIIISPNPIDEMLLFQSIRLSENTAYESIHWKYPDLQEKWGICSHISC